MRFTAVMSHPTVNDLRQELEVIHPPVWHSEEMLMSFRWLRPHMGNRSSLQCC